MTERPRFDLTREPWIPCETLDGERVELGLYDALARAHTLRAVYDGSPLVTAALHRLLLAVLHRCFSTARLEDWKRLWSAGRFEEAALQTYFEAWRHRFDLLDPERPFLQSPGLEFEPLPIARLPLERSTHSGAVHLVEPMPEGAVPTMPLAQAARELLAYLAYAGGGRIPNEADSRKAGMLRAGVMVLLVGRTLFETLTLNLLRHEPAAGEPIPCTPEDAPAWEQPAPAQREIRPPRGWLDLLTWQSRRVLLCTDIRGDQRVATGFITAAGADPSGPTVHDPMMAWRKSDTMGIVPLRLDPDRALWRDSEALLRLRGTGADARPPQACARVEALVARGYLTRSQRFTLEMLGMATNKAAIDLWRHERMPLPVALLAQQERVAELAEALSEAEKGAHALTEALRRLGEAVVSPGYDPRVKTSRKPLREDVSRIVDATAAVGVYWSSLREHFDALVLGLGADDAAPADGPAPDPEAAVASARDAWRRAVLRTANDAYAQASRALGDTAPVLKGAAWGQQTLARGLAKLAPPKTQGETR